VRKREKKEQAAWLTYVLEVLIATSFPTIPIYPKDFETFSSVFIKNFAKQTV
jgi:hypothetical protein